MALYGIFIQRWALSIAWQKAKTAEFFGKDSAPWIEAVWHVPAECARFFVVCANLFLGVFVGIVAAPMTVTHPDQASALSWVFTGVLIINEFVQVGAATLNVIGHFRVRKSLR